MSTQMRSFPFVFKLIVILAKPFAIAPAKAAEAPVLLATSDALHGITGGYFERSRMVRPRTKHDTPGNRKKLWDRSMEIMQAYLTPA